MSCRICMVIPGASECGKCCGAGCLPVSFGWLATVNGGNFSQGNKILTISPRALSRIHHNGKSTVSFVFPPCWLSPMGPTSTYQCSYLLCAGYVSGEGFHLRMLFGTSCPGYITARALPHRSDRHVPLSAATSQRPCCYVPVTAPARPLPQRGILHSGYRLLVVPAVKL